MPSENPTPGRCNAKVRPREGEHNGGYCRNTAAIPDRLGGNGRCRFHGGLSGGGIATDAAFRRLGILKGRPRPGRGAAQTPGGAYGAFLRACIKPQYREIFDGAGHTDLKTELQLWRTKIAEFTDLLAQPDLAIAAGIEPAALHDLLARSTKMVESLSATQHTMHPESDAVGSFNVTLKLDEASMAKISTLDVPDLETDATIVESVEIVKHEVITEATSHFLEELEDAL